MKKKVPVKMDVSASMPNVQIEERAKEDKGFWRMLAEFLFGFAVADAVREDKTARETISMDPKLFRLFGGELAKCGNKKFLGFNWFDCCGDAPTGGKKKLIEICGFGRMCTEGSKQLVVARSQGQTIPLPSLNKSEGTIIEKSEKNFLKHDSWIARWIIEWSRYDLAKKGYLQFEEPITETIEYEIDPKTKQKKEKRRIKKADTKGLSIEQLDKVDFEIKEEWLQDVESAYKMSKNQIDSSSKKVKISKGNFGLYGSSSKKKKRIVR